MKRQISPALVTVHLVQEDGSHVYIEYVPESLELERVLDGRIHDAAKLFEQLETDGFFDWPDSSLVPPPGIDVDSDPFVIAMDTGKRIRRMFTREPNINPVVQALLDTLDASVGDLAESDGCLVCIPRLMRLRDNDLQEIKETSEPWARDLIRFSIGPFPTVVPSREAERSTLAKQREFSIQAAQNTYHVRCIDWP